MVEDENADVVETVVEESHEVSCEDPLNSVEHAPAHEGAAPNALPPCADCAHGFRSYGMLCNRKEDEFFGGGSLTYQVRRTPDCEFAHPPKWHLLLRKHNYTVFCAGLAFLLGGWVGYLLSALL